MRVVRSQSIYTTNGIGNGAATVKTTPGPTGILSIYLNEKK